MTPKQASILVALVLLLEAVGSAVAAGPGHPQTLAGASASPTATATQGHGNPNKPAKGAKASEQPEPSEEAEQSESPEASGGAPSAAEIARIVANLKAAGISVTADQLTSMAAKVGLGGAVRVFVFAHASGKTPDQILAMFQGGQGWGQIVKELGLKINPGLGGIMGKGHAKNPKASTQP
jgi:hypothetical protein